MSDLVNFIIMLTVFVGYITFIWIKYGVQGSISASYYVLPVQLKPLFTLFCWGFALPAIILGDSLLMVLAGSAIAFVGAAAAFKDSLTKDVHMASAAIGVALSQASILFDFRMWWINLVFIIPSIIILLLKKRITTYFWWIEILAFITICYVLGAVRL